MLPHGITSSQLVYEIDDDLAEDHNFGYCDILVPESGIPGRDK